MLKRPSSRSKAKASEVNLNLVPILDAFVTLITFLLFTATFIAITVLDSPAPLLAPPEEQIEKLKEKPLQLTVQIQANQMFISDWSGSREVYKILNIANPETGESQYDLEKFHEILVQIKRRHALETKLILKPEAGVAYESIVHIMDAARSFEKTDPPLYKKNVQGVDEPEQRLFPEIIFGNILS